MGQRHSIWSISAKMILQEFISRHYISEETMIKKYTSKLMLLSLTILFAAACSPVETEQKPPDSSSPVVRVEREATYRAITLDEKIAEADFIFTGIVQESSDYYWNQESGEIWINEENDGVEAKAVLMQNVELTVIRPIYGQLETGSPVTVTILPRKYYLERDPANNTFVAVIQEGEYESGTKVLVFGQNVETYWREGRKLMLMAYAYSDQGALHSIDADEKIDFFTGSANRTPLNEFIDQVNARKIRNEVNVDQ
jgi:hypothetical protein